MVENTTLIAGQIEIIKPKRGRPKKIQPTLEVNRLAINIEPDLNLIQCLSELKVDDRMLETMFTNSELDFLFSHDGGVPHSTNIMAIGEPGVGKTTTLLDLLSKVKTNNKDSEISLIRNLVDTISCC